MTEQFIIFMIGEPWLFIIYQCLSQVWTALSTLTEKIQSVAYSLTKRQGALYTSTSMGITKSRSPAASTLVTSGYLKILFFPSSATLQGNHLGFKTISLFSHVRYKMVFI